MPEVAQVPNFESKNIVKKGNEMSWTIPVEGAGTITLRWNTEGEKKSGFGATLGRAAGAVANASVSTVSFGQVDLNKIKDATTRDQIAKIGKGKEHYPVDAQAAVELAEKLATIPQGKIFYKNGTGLVVASGDKIIGSKAGKPEDFGRTSIAVSDGDKSRVKSRAENIQGITNTIPMDVQLGSTPTPAASNLPPVNTAAGIYNKADNTPYSFNKAAFLGLVKESYPKLLVSEVTGIEESTQKLDRAFSDLAANSKVSRSVSGNITKFENVNGSVELDRKKIFESSPAAAKAAIDELVSNINGLLKKNF